MKKSKRKFLQQLIQVRIEDDPQEIAANLLEIAFNGESNEDRAEDIGDLIDDAITIEGVVGGFLEGLDDSAAEQLAEVSLELVDQAKVRILERIDLQIEELEERLRDGGVSDDLIDEIRGILRLDELAA